MGETLEDIKRIEVNSEYILEWECGAWRPYERERFGTKWHISGALGENDESEIRQKLEPFAKHFNVDLSSLGYIGNVNLRKIASASPRN